MAPKLTDRIKSLDLYALFELSVDATEKEIKKSYRKRALKCHPDKNPDNPKAAEEFQDLADAFDVLLDEDLRKAYDHVLKARKASEVRNRQLDAKRRKLKDELEAREAAARSESVKRLSEQEQREAEIKRLRKEGERLLEEEQERVRAEAAERRKRDANLPKVVMIKWRDTEEGGSYDEMSLRKIFSLYGAIAAVVVKPAKKAKGKRSAVVEFSAGLSAFEAARRETGRLNCPLNVSVMGVAEPTVDQPKPDRISSDEKERQMMRNLEIAALKQKEDREREKDERERRESEMMANLARAAKKQEEEKKLKETNGESVEDDGEDISEEMEEEIIKGLRMLAEKQRAKMKQT